MADEIIIEVYRELGVYERHFNQIQNVYRGLTSTWFFAGFASIGFLYSSKLAESFPSKLEVASSFITLTIATFIILFWMMDIMVYHKLLRAAGRIAEILEYSNERFPNLRKSMGEQTRTLNVRSAISIFYITPSLILSIVAIIFMYSAWSSNKCIINILLVIWLSLLIIGNVLILIFQKRR